LYFQERDEGKVVQKPMVEGGTLHTFALPNLRGLWVNCDESLLALFFDSGDLLVVPPSHSSFTASNDSGKAFPVVARFSGVCGWAWHPNQPADFLLLDGMGKATQVSRSGGVQVLHEKGATAVGWLPFSCKPIVGMTTGHVFFPGGQALVDPPQEIRFVQGCGDPRSEFVLAGTMDDDSNAELFLILLGAAEPIMKRVPCGLADRKVTLRFQRCLIPGWNCIVLAGNNNAEIFCVGRSEESDQAAKHWKLWNLPEGGACSAPYDGTNPPGIVGLSLNTRNTVPQAWDNKMEPRSPGPILLFLDSNGNLEFYFAVHDKKHGKATFAAGKVGVTPTLHHPGQQGRFADTSSNRKDKPKAELSSSFTPCFSPIGRSKRPCICR
jgi:hypothetical protein